VLLFGADSLARSRKGVAHLLEALARLLERQPDVWLLTLGAAGDVEWATDRVRAVGPCDDEALQSVVYSAADVTVVPSVADNQPLMAVESLACGVPVAGFEVGGVPEVVRHEETGLTVPAGDAPALADALARLLGDDDARARMADAARRLALSEHSLEVQAERYVRVYERACATTPSGHRR
jgi:glycosyltransferase involved in cell wall biosynthesis